MHTLIVLLLTHLLAPLKTSAVALFILVGAGGLLLTGAFAPVPNEAAGRTPASQLVDLGCGAALLTQATAFARLEFDYQQAVRDLATVREEAQAAALRQNKALRDDGLSAIERDARAELVSARDSARRAIASADDLSPCQRGPDGGAIFDIAELRHRYDVIVDRALDAFKSTVRRAADRFALAVQNAPLKVRRVTSASNASNSNSR